MASSSLSPFLGTGALSAGNRDAEPQLSWLLLAAKMLSCHCTDSEGHIFTGMALSAQTDAQTSGEVQK